MAWPYSLLHRLGQLSRRKVAREFAQACTNPAEAQWRCLERILSANADTEYGRKFGFDGVKSASDYRASVPLSTYEDLRGYIEREKAGEAKTLVGQKPEFYARTSGTAGKPKDVPINEQYRAEFQKTMLISTWHVYRAVPHAFRGQLLYFVGAYQIDTAKDGTPIGTISGYNYRKMPPLLRKIYAWPSELFEVTDLGTRNFLALLLAAQGRVSIVAGIFPSTVVYMFRHLEEHCEALADALRTGRLPDALTLTDDERAFFASRLVPRPRIADAILAAKEAGTPIVPALLPDLGLVYCWTSAAAAAYVPELRSQVGSRVAIADAIYSASEGWCSVPMAGATPGGALAITSHFLEFLPVEAYEGGDETTKLAQEIEVGRHYYIVITSSAGMYRYVLGDIVEVTGYYEETPMIRFVRKGGAACNICGELLDETHVTTAVAEVAANAGVRMSWFAAAPNRQGDTPRYVLYAEPDGGDLPESFSRRVDEAMASNCWTYRDRVGSTLAPLEVRLVPAGSYQAWRQEQVENGAAESQLKITHLVDDVAKLPSALVTASRPHP